MKTTVVITTINESAPAVDLIIENAGKHPHWDVVLVGDEKNPGISRQGAHCIGIHSQMNGIWALARAMPVRHYARKNVGYLHAVSRGAAWIVDTDDDNYPREGFWADRSERVSGRMLTATGWQNPYAYFCGEEVWPRGLPLEEVRTSSIVRPTSFCAGVKCPVQQGLADENPDVDAVFRLTRTLPVRFRADEPLILGVGAWAPFNSQNTTFHQSVAELLYLPSFCSFRMTDIWRGLVSQRILWENGWNLSFHSATVWQERNEHNLIRDFEAEVEGYLLLNKCVSCLAELRLDRGESSIGANLIRCYEALASLKAVDRAEIGLVRLWVSEMAQARRAHGERAA